MPVKAILFDFGDTLIHTDKFDYDTCLKKVYENLTKDKVAVPYEECKKTYFEVRNRLYKETENSLQEPDFSQRLTETLKHFGYSFNKEDPVITRGAEAFAESFAPLMQIDPYVPKLLKQLKQKGKYKIGLVSNFAHQHAVGKTLEQFGIAKYFDTLTISGKIGWRKPSPKIFEKALQALGVNASETVFVGDSAKHDIEGAKKCGIKTILVKKESNNEDEETGNPDKRIFDLRELPRALSEI